MRTIRCSDRVGGVYLPGVPARGYLPGGIPTWGCTCMGGDVPAQEGSVPAQEGDVPAWV